jgi:hypothetical protein
MPKPASSAIMGNRVPAGSMESRRGSVLRDGGCRRLPALPEGREEGLAFLADLLEVGGKRPLNGEVTYFAKNGRTNVFIVQNAGVTSTSFGDTKTKGPGSGAVPIEVEFWSRTFTKV